MSCNHGAAHDSGMQERGETMASDRAGPAPTETGGERGDGMQHRRKQVEDMMRRQEVGYDCF